MDMHFGWADLFGHGASHFQIKYFEPELKPIVAVHLINQWSSIKEQVSQQRG